MIYWNVTTSIVNADWTYQLNVESNISDLEYRNCTYIQQPWINTIPKVWDTVLLMVIKKWDYAVLGITSFTATPHLEIQADTIKLVASSITENATNITMTWTSITANWEDLTIDDIWAS